MIKLENYEVVGWEHAIRGMRNPKNSWDRSDSPINKECDYYVDCEGCPGYENDEICDKMIEDNVYLIGPNDHKLMMQLAAGGPVHAKYRRMIAVYVDITAPLYWWKEFDTYKVGTVSDSCSTMHKIHDKEFTLEDFSHEHLLDDGDNENVPLMVDPNDYENAFSPVNIFVLTVRMLNACRAKFIDIDNKLKKDISQEKIIELTKVKKELWWQMIQLLPSSYNQRRTIMLNYEVLTGMYHDRKNHKLDEWRTFCEWIESLPYSEIITGEQKDEEMQKI